MQMERHCYVIDFIKRAEMGADVWRWYFGTGDEGSALRLSDVELFHFGLEGGSLHSEPSGGTGRASNHPAAFPQGFDDMVPFSLL